MRIIEIRAEDLDPRDFPFGLDWCTEIGLSARKHLTGEQWEQFKQDLVKSMEGDRLMQAQHIQLVLVGAIAYFLTPWGTRPVARDAFEEEAIDALIAAGAGDPFVVYTLAYEAGQRANRRALQQATTLRPLAPRESPRKLTLAEVEEVVAEQSILVLEARTALLHAIAFLEESEEEGGCDHSLGQDSKE
jgi:hypothetical protein